jgi:hypothetical protein
MNSAYSQSTSPQIVSTAGETFQGTSIQIDWTLGELAITTMQSSSFQITQGFHQPNYILTSLDELPEAIGQIKIYPNPTSDLLEMNLIFDQKRNVQIQIFDIQGKQILEKHNEGQQISESISLVELPSGNYFIKVKIDGNKFSQTFKVQKIK